MVTQLLRVSPTIFLEPTLHSFIKFFKHPVAPFWGTPHRCTACDKKRVWFSWGKKSNIPNTIPAIVLIKRSSHHLPSFFISKILQQPIPLQIVGLLLKYTRPPPKILLEHIDIAPSTLSYHLQKLLKHHIVEVTIRKVDRLYFFVDKAQIESLLKQYKPFNLFESFKDLWMHLDVD